MLKYYLTQFIYQMVLSRNCKYHSRTVVANLSDLMNHQRSADHQLATAALGFA